jgi:hypothetical protein
MAQINPDHGQKGKTTEEENVPTVPVKTTEGENVPTVSVKTTEEENVPTVSVKTTEEEKVPTVPVKTTGELNKTQNGLEYPMPSKAQNERTSKNTENLLQKPKQEQYKST